MKADSQPGPPTTSDDPKARKLKDVAKLLVMPEGITGSFWPAIRETCTDRLGIAFDGWQDGIAGLCLAHRDDKALSHTIGGVGISICRQTGKTHTLVGLVFTMCVEFPGLLVIWTSHHVKTNSETFMAVQGYAKRDTIAPFVKRVYTGSGDEEVRFTNGSRILFGARERGFGRGIAGVDVLISDEAQILSQRAMQDMLATMNTSRLGLHVYAGTPPKPGDNSENFSRMRQEAKAGEAVDMVWIEFGAEDGGDIDDPVQWAKANPSVPHRTPLMSIQRLRRRLDDGGFRREALGLWDADEASVFDLERWTALKIPNASPPRSAALVIDVSPDRRYSTIGVAGELDDEKTLIMALPLRGTNTILGRVKKLLEERDIVDVAITGGAARALEGDLVKAGIDYAKLGTSDMAAAYATLQEAIKAGSVAHIGQDELDTAMMMAKTRFWMTGEAEVFDRRGYSADVSPAVACSAALYRWGLQQAPLPVII